MTGPIPALALLSLSVFVIVLGERSGPETRDRLAYAGGALLVGGLTLVGLGLPLFR